MIGLMALLAAGCQPTTDSGQALEANKLKPVAEEPEQPAVEEPAMQVSIFSRIGQKVNFETLNHEGAITPSADFQGRVILVLFWNSTGAPAMDAIDEMIKWHEEFEPKGLTIIALNSLEHDDLKAPDDQKKQRSQEVVERVFKTKSIPYLLGVFGDGVSNTWGIRGVPTFVLIDRDSRVLYAQEGVKKEQLADFKTRVEAALEATPRAR